MLIFKTPPHKGKTNVLSLKLLDKGRKGGKDGGNRNSVLSTQYCAVGPSLDKYLSSERCVLKAHLPPLLVFFLGFEIQK